MLNEIYSTQPEWDENNHPLAPDYGDRYFSSYGGLDESRHVFLRGNQLPERWQTREHFVIAETGFGTGLNFLATWKAWADDPQRCHTLHFISIEKHPIPASQLAKLAACWPELTPYYTGLLQHYPPALAGSHLLTFAEGRVRLLLCFADIEDALQELETGAGVDAWYLDGFTPARNQAMWAPAVLQAVAAHSAPGATLATFSVAGQVKRNVLAAGFQVEKRAGFGPKREMLTARIATPLPISPTNPWYSRPDTPIKTRTVTVVGAGIAGCQIAHALAVRGWQVTLLELHAHPATEASGNQAGVLTPKMTAEPDWGERFYRQAFLFAVRQLQQLTADGHQIDWNPCGALQLNHNERELKRWEALLTRRLPADFMQLPDAPAASGLAGIELPYGGSFFPQGGWLNPASLCEALIRHRNIRVLYHTQAISLQRNDSQDEWHTLGKDGQLLSQSSVVVLAAGKDIQSFTQSSFLPFTPVRGQTSLAQASAASQPLRITLGHEGYLTPAQKGLHVFGATFERGQTEADLTPQADTCNLQQLTHYLPALAQTLTHLHSGHSAIRMTTPDRYPVVGAIPDKDYFQQHYPALRHGNPHQFYPSARYLPGLFISAGYGSRGLSTSAWCSEVLAALINREPLPCERSLYYKLHPARYLIHRLKRGEN